MVKPQKLNRGDKVCVVSLSRGILGEGYCSHQIELGTKRLKELGLDVVFMPNSLKGVKTIEENPDLRALDLKEAFKDNSIKAIICAIGGIDTYKTICYLLDDEEFKKLCITKPKIFLGFSDSTINHLMLYRLGLKTFYGLNFLSDLAELAKNMLPYTKEAYERLFINESSFYIKPSDCYYINRTDFSINSLNTECLLIKDNIGYEVLFGKGDVFGILYGGCLESIYSTLDNSDENKECFEVFNKYNILLDEKELSDVVLFLETSEVKTSPIEFRKMISLLIKKNILNSVKALIFGKPYDNVYYDEYNEILIELTKDFNLPIMVNVNFGHSIPRTIIPYGAKVLVNFSNKTIEILEEIFSK